MNWAVQELKHLDTIEILNEAFEKSLVHLNEDYLMAWRVLFSAQQRKIDNQLIRNKSNETISV